MQKALHLFILTISITLTGYSQLRPDDYNNPIVQKEQRGTTENFVNLIEQGKVDDAMKLIDTSFLQTKNKYRDSLTAYHKELSKYLKTTKLSLVIVYPESKFNTYRCRYYNEKGEFFYIDIYYNGGQPNSLITKICKKSEKELVKERKELAKRVEEEEKTGPPQPPLPPPPGIELKPVKKND